MVQMVQLVQVPSHTHTRTREKRLFRHNGYFMTVCCYGKQTQKHSRAYTTADLYARVCAYVRIHVCVKMPAPIAPFAPFTLFS